LTKQNISGIIDLLMKDVNARLSEKELSIELTEDAKHLIAEEAYDPIYGARPLKRYLQKNVETLAARLILSGEVDQDDVILVDREGDGLKAIVKKR
ncbi:MAG: type VI secretion system ATPase TssH, partial [Lachnospiraceae bacterium]|nr:type VI secretion system ATPase TssH [Lachnospiraceae bacterium]